jgi:cytochrome c peroxidase
VSLYTDLQQHDVGTADAYGEWFGPLIDTPTLRFLYDSAPYLHDGSAATLYEVLTSANPNDEHGVTSHLTEGEIEDLVSFLLILPFGE